MERFHRILSQLARHRNVFILAAVDRIKASHCLCTTRDPMHAAF